MSDDAARLYERIDRLIAEVRREAADILRGWALTGERASFAASARNLAGYLALRRRDLRDLQRELTGLGLSSLGRLEGRVLPTLEAVRARLLASLGKSPLRRPSGRALFAGERRLAANTEAMFGPAGLSASAALLVTCPTEAADDPAFMREMADKGVQAVRINCAHDDADAWGRMIGHLRAAEAASGRRIRVFMDLAGPKIRTGEIREAAGGGRAVRGDLLAICRPGRLDEVSLAERSHVVECTLPEALDGARAGDRLFVDDGKLGARIEAVEPWGVTARVVRTATKGLRLKPEKGLNFPDFHIQIPALTAKDRADLAFVAAHADAVEFSFVQSAADVAALQQALAELRPDDWRGLGLVLKIETAQAVANLPEMIVHAADRQPTAVMIARGDLAVEIGFARTAEIQEEILWLCEAADTPVIWATQVLEHLVRKGAPLRGEMTDAAMAARAECVMLNKGPYLAEAIDEMTVLFARMHDHQRKKSPLMRRLGSW